MILRWLATVNIPSNGQCFEPRLTIYRSCQGLDIDDGIRHALLRCQSILRPTICKFLSLKMDTN